MHLQANNKCVVGIKVRNKFESAIQGNDLPFDVFLEDAELFELRSLGAIQ